MTRARRERLIVEHMPMVRRIAGQVARKFSSRLSVDDFIQDGMVGLCEAAMRCSRVTSFQQYAYFRVRGAMVDAHRRKQYREELNLSIEGMAAVAGGRAFAGARTDGVAVAGPGASVTSRDPAPLPDEFACRRQMLALAAAAIATLPEDERDVIRQALAGAKLAAIGASRARSATWARGKLAAAQAKVALAVAGRAA